MRQGGEEIKKPTVERIPLGSGDWDSKLLEYWRRSGLSANDLWMAELKMHLFGRKRAYDYLNSQVVEISSGCIQFSMF